VGAAWCSPPLVVIGGLSFDRNPIFMPLFWVALIGNFGLFLGRQNAAMKGNNGTGSCRSWRPTA